MSAAVMGWLDADEWWEALAGELPREPPEEEASEPKDWWWDDD